MSETEFRIVTLAERKARKTAQKVAAAAAIKDALRTFVKEHPGAGRFIVFGSAATGKLRYDSDFDVLVDFPGELEAKAWNAVEDACEMGGMDADVFSVGMSSETFVDSILSRDVEIIG